MLTKWTRRTGADKRVVNDVIKRLRNESPGRGSKKPTKSLVVRGRRARLFYWTMNLLADKPLKSAMHGQCDARPTVTFPVVERHRPLTGSTLYCLITETHVCEQLA